jgi:hypothetical protein
MRTLIVLTALLILACPNSARGQAIAGDIDGGIFDQHTGDAVALVTITVSGDNLQIPRSSLSISDGFFRIKGLPVGIYTVTLQHISYQTMSYDDVVIRRIKGLPVGIYTVTLQHISYQTMSYDDVIVQLGRTTSLGRTELMITTFEVDTIIVSTRRPVLDFATTEVSNNLSSEVLNQLPAPRDYREVIAYLPHANASFLGDNTNVAGGTGTENQYFIEGVNVTDPFLASSGTRLPQNFVREVQVKKGGYEAEHGSATGGIINVITHSGSNDFNGQAFGFLTNNNVSSDSRRGIAEFNQSDFARYDLGLTLGGAIARDKLWYFVAYNPTFQNESLQIPGLDYYDDETVSHLFAGKLSWSPGPSTSLDLTVFGDPTHQDKVGGSFMIPPLSTQLNADPLLVDRTSGAITANLRGRRLFGDRAIVEASLSRVEAKNEERAATEIGRTEVTYIDLYTSTLSGGMQMWFDHHTVRWAGKLSTTVFAGGHELKVGASYENIALDEEWIVQTPDGRPGHLVRTGVDQWQTITLLNDFDISHRLPSAFLQDSWRVTDRLRVNVGVRWDGIYIVNPEGEVVQSIDDGFQPRAGFIYQLDESGGQKVYGSYGRFYEQLPMIASSWYFGDFYQVTDFYDQNPLPDFTATPVGGYVLDNSSLLSDDLKGQYLDEFTVGYERRVGATWRAGVRGIYRNLGEVIENTINPDGTVTLGNPGRGSMDHLAEPVRRYTALEFSLENTFGKKLHMASSYVLSETYGNFPGVFDSDGRNPHAHVSTQYWTADQISEGPLPNDRPHVFKMYGSYDFGFGMTAGGFFTWQSGTPLSDYGGTWAGPDSYSHLVPRGTAGRTPSIWDASLRFSYDLSTLTGGVGRARSRLLFDVFHLFGQKEKVDIDQVRYFGPTDALGNQTGPNPNLGTVKAYQPPMTIRFGIETSF